MKASVSVARASRIVGWDKVVLTARCVLVYAEGGADVEGPGDAPAEGRRTVYGAADGVGCRGLARTVWVSSQRAWARPIRRQNPDSLCRSGGHGCGAPSPRGPAGSDRTGTVCVLPSPGARTAAELPAGRGSRLTRRPGRQVPPNVTARRGRRRGRRAGQPVADVRHFAVVAPNGSAWADSRSWRATDEVSRRSAGTRRVRARPAPCARWRTAGDPRPSPQWPARARHVGSLGASDQGDGTRVP
jgi:hypothetical protein